MNGKMTLTLSDWVRRLPDKSDGRRLRRAHRGGVRAQFRPRGAHRGAGALGALRAAGRSARAAYGVSTFIIIIGCVNMFRILAAYAHRSVHVAPTVGLGALRAAEISTRTAYGVSTFHH